MKPKFQYTLSRYTDNRTGKVDVFISQYAGEGNMKEGVQNYADKICSKVFRMVGDKDSLEIRLIPEEEAEKFVNNHRITKDVLADFDGYPVI